MTDIDDEWRSTELAQQGLDVIRPLLVRLGAAERERDAALRENQRLGGQLARILAACDAADRSGTAEQLIWDIGIAAQVPEDEQYETGWDYTYGGNPDAMRWSPAAKPRPADLVAPTAFRTIGWTSEGGFTGEQARALAVRAISHMVEELARGFQDIARAVAAALRKIRAWKREQMITLRAIKRARRTRRK